MHRAPAGHETLNDDRAICRVVVVPKFITPKGSRVVQFPLACESRRFSCPNALTRRAVLLRARWLRAAPST